MSYDYLIEVLGLLIILKSLLHGIYIFPFYIVHFRLRRFGNAFFFSSIATIFVKVSDAADGGRFLKFFVAISKVS